MKRKRKLTQAHKLKISDAHLAMHARVLKEAKKRRTPTLIEEAEGKVLRALCRALWAHYQDGVRPGVHVAYLGDQWYVSLKRYYIGSVFDEEHEKIVCSGNGETLLDALHTVAKRWHESITRGDNLLGQLQATLDGMRR